MYKIVLAFSNEKNRTRIYETLEAEGYTPKNMCRTGKEAIREIRRLGGGIIICGCRLPDMTADDLMYYVNGIASVIAVGQPVMLDMCENEDIYKLSTPLRKNKLISAVAYVLQKDCTVAEAKTSVRTEEEKEIINCAKQLLMKHNKISEPEAYRFIQKNSMDIGFKMTSTARLIIRHYNL